ncbi:MAG: hypothetical protein WCE94_02905 [Candidatus Methanoperedens sp.]
MEKKEIKEQLEYAKESMGFTPEIMQLIGGEAPEWFKLYRASDKAMWTDTAYDSCSTKGVVGCRPHGWPRQ